MSETSLEERYHEPWRTPREVQALARWHIDIGPVQFQYDLYHRSSRLLAREEEGAMPGQTCDALRAPYWRSEILQLMFWMKAEGFGDEADATLLERFLGVDAHVDVQHLDRLLEEGYVERVGDRYKLSEAGVRKGGLEFAASFEELAGPVHRECRGGFWCEKSCDKLRLLE